MDYLTILGFLCFLNLLLPFSLRAYLMHWKLRSGFSTGSKLHHSDDTFIQLRRAFRIRYVMFELFLAFSILMAGMIVILSVYVVWNQVGPYILGVGLPDIRMDSPLTTGVFLFLVCMIGIPWFLFHYVSVPSIRDTHQLCKELRDCIQTFDRNASRRNSEGSGSIRSTRSR